MSVLFMEGFEDIESRSDLLARGETGVGALVYSGVDTARYAGGKSLYRGYYGAGETQYIFQRPLPQLKDSVNTSMSVMLSSNSVQRGINSNVNRGPNGEYVAGMNTNVASSNWYLVSLDGINWKGQIASMASGTFPYGISSLLWLPNKNLWLAVGGVNTGNTVYWGVSANLEGPYTISSFTVSGTSISQLRPALYYDAPTDTAFVVTTSGGLWRYNQTANTWANMMINPFAAAVTYPMAVTNGTRWYSAAASSLYYSDDVSTGTMTERPGMFTSASVASLAYGNNTLVVAVIGNRIAHLYYSKDEGVTFTGILLPGVSTAVNSATMVAFFKGKFYATATGGGAGTVFTSTDGVTWTSEKTTGNTIPPSPGSVQLAATSDYLYYGTTSMPMILYSSTGTDVNSMPNGYVDNVNFVAGYGTGLYLNLQPTRSLQVQIGTAGTDAVLRAGLPNGTQVQISPNVVIERDKWALLEMSAVRNSATSMDVSISYNGMPVYSNSIATPSPIYSGLITPSNGAYYPFVTNGVTTVWAQLNANGVTGSSERNLGMVNTPATYNAIGILRNAVWTGKQFVLIGNTGLSVSFDGTPASWRMVLQTSGTILSPAGVNYTTGTILVGDYNTATGRYYRSTDHGETWSQLNITGSTSIIMELFYLNGLWIAVPSSANPDQWYYSADDGITWTRTQILGADASLNEETLPAYGVYIGANFRHTEVNGQMAITLSTSALPARLYYISVSGTTISAKLIPGGSVYTNQAFMAFNGRYFVTQGASGPTHRALEVATGTWTTWSAGSSFTTGIAAVGGVFATGSNTSGTNLAYAIVPEWFDGAIDAVIDGRSFSHTDDLVVNDNTSPHAGPLGEARILKVPLDKDVQPEWSPNPSNLTNVQAATQQPVSAATAYVESNAVGQKDIYGTTAFTVPPGYRAAAVQVEGYYSRALNSIPSAKLGVRSGTDEDTTSEVYVTAPIGTKMYTAKILNTAPGGTAWTASTIASSEVTNERVV